MKLRQLKIGDTFVHLVDDELYLVVGPYISGTVLVKRLRSSEVILLPGDERVESLGGMAYA